MKLQVDNRFIAPYYMEVDNDITQTNQREKYIGQYYAQIIGMQS